MASSSSSPGRSTSSATAGRGTRGPETRGVATRGPVTCTRRPGGPWSSGRGTPGAAPRGRGTPGAGTRGPEIRGPEIRGRATRGNEGELNARTAGTSAFGPDADHVRRRGRTGRRDRAITRCLEVERTRLDRVGRPGARGRARGTVHPSGPVPDRDVERLPH